MSVENKLFGGRFEPQKGALKKDSTLPVYATFTRAKNKSIAKTILHAEFLKFAPDYAEDYFAPKVWETVEGMFCVAEGQFYTDAFTGDIIWNAEKGEPERVLTEPELSDDSEQLNVNEPEEKMKQVKDLDVLGRAYCLAVFGAIDEINSSQYGQLIDMLNDDEFSSLREQAEAIAKEPRVLALLPDKQTECLVWVRQKARENAKWPDYKNLFTKWLDTPADKREPVKLKTDEPETGDETHTETGCTLGGGNVTDRPYTHNLASLRREVCIGILAVAMDFDIYELPHAIHERAKKMEEIGSDERFTAWWKQFRRTPGILDFSKAAIIALIKSAPEAIYLDPVALREYINKNLTESDHANPDPLVIDIACGRTIAPLPQSNTDTSEESDSSESSDEQINADIDRTLTERAAIEESTSNEGEKQEVFEREDDRLPVSDREIEIAHALNDLMSGHTNIVGKEEIESIVSSAGHLICYVFPHLVSDITATEYFLSPNFTDDEIQDVATTILESWSDSEHIRQKVAMDAIVEYRKPVPPKKQSSPEPEPEPEIITSDLQIPATEPAALTWRQQLIIAALRGMTSNPAYSGMHEDIPFMAVTLADGVISAEIAP